MDGPQYACNYSKESEEDAQKFDAVFENRLDYTKAIHAEVRVWVHANVER